MISCVVLGGCAGIPGGASYSDIKKTKPVVYKSSHTPSEATKCALERIDEDYGEMTGSIRTGSRPNVLEVRVKSFGGLGAVAEYEQAGTGSTVTVWTADPYEQKQNVIKRLTQDC